MKSQKTIEMLTSAIDLMVINKQEYSPLTIAEMKNIIELLQATTPPLTTGPDQSDPRCQACIVNRDVYLKQTVDDLETAREELARLKTPPPSGTGEDVAKLKKELELAYHYISTILKEEPSGEFRINEAGVKTPIYVHLGECSGDRTVPPGTPNSCCCCMPKKKTAQAELTRLRAVGEAVEKYQRAYNENDRLSYTTTGCSHECKVAYENVHKTREELFAIFNQQALKGVEGGE